MINSFTIFFEDILNEVSGQCAGLGVLSNSDVLAPELGMPNGK